MSVQLWAVPLPVGVLVHNSFWLARLATGALSLRMDCIANAMPRAMELPMKKRRPPPLSRMHVTKSWVVKRGGAEHCARLVLGKKYGGHTR